MPLDPSIFMQYAGLRQRQNEQLQNTFENAQERSLKQKALEIEKATKGFDIEKMAQAYAMKKEMGAPTTPEEEGAFNAFQKFQSAELGINPETGETYPKFRPFNYGGAANSTPFVPAHVPNSVPSGGFDLGLLNGPGNIGAQGQGSNPAITTPYDEIQPRMMNTGDIEAQLANTPVGKQTTIPQQRGFDISSIQIPVTGQNVAARQKQMEANTDLQKKALEADINASEAGASKRAQLEQENQVNLEAKQKGLSDLTSAIDMMIEDAKGTPSGALEGAAASLTSFLGKPNEQAVKRARFASGTAISGLQSRIAFLKGQGTITDKEAEQALSFIPKPDDPIEIKMEKLKGGKDYINSLIGGASPQKPNAPGFRYLGKKN